MKNGYAARLQDSFNKDGGFYLQEEFRWLGDYLATEKGHGWYRGSTAGGFWVRRAIDGTDAQMFGLLRTLLQTFDPEYLGRP